VKKKQEKHRLHDDHPPKQRLGGGPNPTQVGNENQQQQRRKKGRSKPVARILKDQGLAAVKGDGGGPSVGCHGGGITQKRREWRTGPQERRRGREKKKRGFHRGGGGVERLGNRTDHKVSGKKTIWPGGPSQHREPKPKRREWRMMETGGRAVAGRISF